MSRYTPITAADVKVGESIRLVIRAPRGELTVTYEGKVRNLSGVRKDGKVIPENVHFDRYVDVTMVDTDYWKVVSLERVLVGLPTSPGSLILTEGGQAGILMRIDGSSEASGYAEWRYTVDEKRIPWQELRSAKILYDAKPTLDE